MGPGAKPAFGVARPMRGGGDPARTNGQPAGLAGGDQFPPVPGAEAPPPPRPADTGPATSADAMNRLTDRMNAVHENTYEAQGFEASVHKIKEQVLPRLLERVDPEAAATLTKDELSEEFRPIIMEVLAELKITTMRYRRWHV